MGLAREEESSNYSHEDENVEPADSIQSNTSPARIGNIYQIMSRQNPVRPANPQVQISAHDILANTSRSCELVNIMSTRIDCRLPRVDNIADNLGQETKDTGSTNRLPIKAEQVMHK